MQSLAEGLKTYGASRTQTLTTTNNLAEREQKVRDAIRAEYEQVCEANPGAAVCPYCDGMGSISLKINDDRHPFFGRAWTCPCQEGIIMAKRLATLFGSVPESHQSFTFEAWDKLPPTVLEPRLRALAACRELLQTGYILTKNGPKPGVVLSGEPGVGKSSIAAALSMSLIEAGKPIAWIDFNEFIASIQATYNRKYQGLPKEQIIAGAQDAPILVFDDMGDYANDDEVSNDVRNNAYAVIYRRHQRKLLTIITTNLSHGQFAVKFHGRIARRVYERCAWVNLKGSDLSGLENTL